MKVNGEVCWEKCVFRANWGTDSERSGALIRAKRGTNPSEVGHFTSRYFGALMRVHQIGGGLYLI